jgi:beta-lactamase class D
MKVIRPHNLVVLFFLFSLHGMALERGIIMVTPLSTGETTIKGDATLQSAEVSPASTFKVVLGWAGLAEQAIDLETRWEVKDRHVPGTPRAIGLEKAMYHSSNDFFVRLGRQLGKKTLKRYMVSSGLFGENLPEDWLGEDWWPVVKAGKLMVTPARNHEWMCRVAKGEGMEPGSVHRDLIRSMSWPSSDPSVQVFGKTGVWGGAVWFNGFGLEGEKKITVVTVMLKGSLERRDEAINYFYRQFEMTWDKEMKARR